MFLTIRRIVTIVFLLALHCSFAQNQSTFISIKEVEIGGAFAGGESSYYGLYLKYSRSLSSSRHYPKAGFGLTAYADFKGESTDLAYLQNDIDMRLIAYLFVGYNFTFDRFDISLELPIGTSIAATKGTLVNERIGFEKEYSTTEHFWHYGLAFSTKFRLSKKNRIGIYGVKPIVKDVAWSPPMIGIGWTRKF